MADVVDVKNINKVQLKERTEQMYSMTMSEKKKMEIAEIMGKPYNSLTTEDKGKLYNYYLEKAKDSFSQALDMAKDTGNLEDLMTETKCLVFDVEEEGVQIGSMN